MRFAHISEDGDKHVQFSFWKVVRVLHPRTPWVFFVIVPLLLSGLFLSLWWIVLGFLSLFQTPTRKPPGPMVGKG